MEVGVVVERVERGEGDVAWMRLVEQLEANDRLERADAVHEDREGGEERVLEKGLYPDLFVASLDLDLVGEFVTGPEQGAVGDAGQEQGSAALRGSDEDDKERPAYFIVAHASFWYPVGQRPRSTSLSDHSRTPPR